MKEHTNMGEKATFPQNNGVPDDQNEEEMEQDVYEDEEDEVDGEFGDMTEEEFNALNSKMDELNSALDNIEEKNDVIYTELKKLLESNREIREQLVNISAPENAATGASQ